MTHAFTDTSLGHRLPIFEKSINAFWIPPRVKEVFSGKAREDSVGLSRIFAKLFLDHMADSKTNPQQPTAGNGFRISAGPVIRLSEDDHLHDFGDVVELPRLSGTPVLFAIARDPRTIFTYWIIDWPSIFGKTPPLDRQVHLRVYKSDGTEETSVATEPMAGNCYVQVAEPRGEYRIEIGYYQPQDNWNFVAVSDPVTMPPDRVSEKLDVDVATLPFHLSFQRLIDLFRASNKDALTEIIARLQKRAVTDEDRALLRPEEWEILRAVDLSLDEMGSARRAFLAAGNGAALRKRTEAIVGLSCASPAHGFGGSSWGSAGL